MLLDYLKCENYKFCEDSVRTYFILDKHLEDSLNAVSSAIQLLEYKVDNIETLTNAFFFENANSGGIASTRKFALANIDGSERVEENTNPNSFNPFANDFGLIYDPLNFYSGKPTGTTSGSDYGSGILNLGFEKPEILNGQLINKKGAFFVDIDFSKNLKIAFNVFVNNVSENVFVNPAIYRRYFIVWDAKNCKKSFYYQDRTTRMKLS